jgi:hypothetical protein
LQAQDLLIDTARDVPLVFREVEFPRAYEIDILVENKRCPLLLPCSCRT